MAKMTIEGVTYEGTPAELAEMVREFTTVAEESKEASEDTTLKVGDKVRVTGLSVFESNYDGQIGTFEDVDEDDDHAVRLSDGFVALYKRHQLEKVTDGATLTAKVDELDNRVTALEKGDKPSYKTEKRAAKIGERILITSARGTSGDYTDGDALEVTATFPENDVVYAYVKVRTGSGRIRNVLTEEYEVIVEDTQAKEIEHNGETYTLVSRKAQAGDVVITTGTTSAFLRKNTRYVVDKRLQIEGFPVYNEGLIRTEANVLVYEKKAPALKVGDYAVVIAKGVGEARSAFEIGDIVSITDMNNPTGKALRPLVRRIDGQAEWYMTIGEEIRKATDAEVAEALKPKTGDIVVITGNTNGSGNEVGDIGKVGGKSPYSTSLAVLVPGGPEKHVYTQLDEMRLATEAERAQYDKAVEDAKKPKLKVDDYVRVKDGADSRHGDIGAGTIVKVTDFGQYSSRKVRVNLLDDSDYDYFKADDLELVDAHVVTFAKIGRKPGEFKKGDIVRVTSGYGPIADGDIGVISHADGSDCPKVRVGTSERYVCVELIAPVESRVDSVA